MHVEATSECTQRRKSARATSIGQMWESGLNTLGIFRRAAIGWVGLVLHRNALVLRLCLCIGVNGRCQLEKMKISDELSPCNCLD